MSNWRIKIFLLLFLSLVLQFCIKDEEKSDITEDNVIDKYTGTWEFNFESKIKNTNGLDSVLQAFSFVGFIAKGKESGYASIIYSPDFDTLNLKVEKDGKILNTYFDPSYPGETSGYFTDDNRFYYYSYLTRNRAVPYTTTYSTLIEGKLLSKSVELIQAPTATTLNANIVSSSSTVLCGKVNPNYGLTEVYFEFGKSELYENIVSADPKEKTGAREYVFNKNIAGLTAETQYHFRIKAVNKAGTSYGADQTFSTSLSSIEQVTDINGNIYNTIRIDSQIWMSENLKVTKLNDGLQISLLTTENDWSSSTDPAYCFYDNNASNGLIYGALYNGYSVNTGKLCPVGWHVPTEQEWRDLTNFLSGNESYGGSLKETGTSHWAFPNEGATNSSGFSALPGGLRQPALSGVNRSFYNIFLIGVWWSSTEYPDGGFYCFTLYNDSPNGGLSRGNMNNGNSVRCVKN